MIKYLLICTTYLINLATSKNVQFSSFFLTFDRLGQDELKDGLPKISTSNATNDSRYSSAGYLLKFSLYLENCVTWIFAEVFAFIFWKSEWIITNLVRWKSAIS